MPYLETLIGAAAAFCTTVSYIPQLQKCWRTGETGDLSLKMLLLLATGLGLWLAYGLMRADAVIMIANAVSLALLGGIMFFKIRGRRQRMEQRHSRPSRIRAQFLKASSLTGEQIRLRATRSGMPL
jgi:MtN3 and saliva related transmembrane protein